MNIVIKRDGRKEQFNPEKIVNAIEKAMACTEIGIDHALAVKIANEISNLGAELDIEKIQDAVENKLMASSRKDVAREYVCFRHDRETIRKTNSAYGTILEIIDAQNDEVNTENSNKNPTINSTQRDYIAGTVSKTLTNDLLLPKDIVEAHKNGLIHFHDADYFIQHMMNCCLINLEDMLQNGTVISGTMIEKPHSFSTACNVATQIIAQVASNQYGGQSITLSHLAPFVEVSRQRIAKEVDKELDGLNVSKERKSEIVESRLKDEIKKGVQTIQYQVVTLMTTNGQTPFITVFMYLNEAKDEKEKADLAMIIEETIKQRYEGVKNEVGAWITPAFPKLVYVLEEDNINKDSKYFYLTELAAKCTAKRLVPDYVSEKKMFEYKVDSNGDGHCYPPMGKRKLQLM